jgi:hypothetical protein
MGRPKKNTAMPRRAAQPELSDGAAAQIQHFLSERLLRFSATYRDQIRRYFEPWHYRLREHRRDIVLTIRSEQQPGLIRRAVCTSASSSRDGYNTSLRFVSCSAAANYAPLAPRQLSSSHLEYPAMPILV